MLTKKFLNENPVKDMSAQRLFYSFLFYGELEEKVDSVSRMYIKRDDEEAKLLKQEMLPEDLLKMMRGKCDTLNYSLLHKKVLEQEEIIIPIVLEKIKTSGNDIFIEHTMKILKKSSKNYCDEIVKIIDDIRSPYALSLACVLVGFIGDESHVELLLKEHSKLKSLYPKENYEQGPLLGLIELKERFKIKC